MNKEEQLREELEDAWFALLMNKIAEEEGKELNRLNEQLNNDPSFAVPEETTRRSLETIRKTIAKEKRRQTGRIAKRVFVRIAVAAMIAGMMIVSACAVSQSFRAATLNLLIQTSDVATRLVPKEVVPERPGASETAEEAPKVLLGYLIPEMPEGFEVVDEWSGESTAWVRFQNATGSTVKIWLMSNIEGAYDLDTEDAIVKSGQMHGYESVLCEKDNAIQIGWYDLSTEKLILVLGKGISQAQIVEIAEGIVLAD